MRGLWMLLLLACLVPQAAGQNSTLNEADLRAIDEVVADKVLPVYVEMAELRQQFENQTTALEVVLVGLRVDLAALDANLSVAQAARMDALSKQLTVAQGSVAALQARVEEVENLTAGVDSRLASGEVEVQVDDDVVEAAVQNVVAGPAFQSRLENGVEAASGDLATQDDVAAVKQAQPAWWIPWSATLALAAAVAVYHHRVVRPLMDGQGPREGDDAEDDEAEEDGEPAFVIPDDDLEEARAKMRELARNTILAPGNGMTHQVDAQPNGAGPVPVVEVANAEASEDEEHQITPDGVQADVESRSASTQPDTPKEPTTRPEDEAESPPQDHAAKAAKQPPRPPEQSAPQGDDSVVKVVQEGEEHASGSEPAERDAAAPARKHWQAYKEGKLDGEALQFALADAYPDVDERQEMLQIAKEAT